jgi:ATP-binding cassette subfamily B (MDR/TAP) protein 1
VVFRAHRLSTIKDADKIITMSKGVWLAISRYSLLHKSEVARINNKDQILEVGTHDQLLENPDGAYSKLVSAQLFREEQEIEGGEVIAGGVALMTREEAELAARDEKPAGAELKCMGSEVSLASEILKQGKGHNVEDSKLTEKSGPKETKHSFFYLFKRMGQLNSGEKWHYLIAFVTAAALGMMYPILAIVFGNIMGVSTFLLPQNT